MAKKKKPKAKAKKAAPKNLKIKKGGKVIAIVTGDHPAFAKAPIKVLSPEPEGRARAKIVKAEALTVRELKKLLAKAPDTAEVWFECDKAWGALSGTRLIDGDTNLLLMKGN